MNNTVVVVIVSTIATVAILYFVIGLYNLRKIMKDRKNSFSITFFTEALCDAAELMFKEPGSGKEKFDWVVELVKKECINRDTKFDYEKIVENIDRYVDKTYNVGK